MSIINANQSAPAQPSIYSLTFDEFQTTLGKEFGSMNMEEFLKNLWTAEENQAIVSALSGGSGVLQSQRSFSLQGTVNNISQKTVEEVWRDVVTDKVESVGESSVQKQQRQATIGEMTLEEFLVRAGAVREENYECKKSNSNFGLDFEVGKEGGMRGGVNGLRSGMFGFGVGCDRIGKGNREVSGLPPVVPNGFNGGVKKGKFDYAFEKVFERRQRRMIKNRESAARSRARKQAYTMELEAELAMLKEENQELEKKHTEVLEVQKKQIIELLNRRLRPKRSCLRRTHTGPW